MNQVFTIDPGFDQEIQELEEFMNPMKIMEPLRWSTTIPHLDKLLIAAPGLSAQLFTKGLELVSVLLLEKSHLKLARPGYQKGVGLYKSNGYHVILLGEKLEIEFVSLVSDAIISLINPNTIVTCFDVEMGMPNDDQQYQEFGTDQVVGTEFKMITGFSASLLSRAFVRKCNLVVYKLYQNAVISSNFEIVLQKAKERFDMPLNMDQKTIEKVLLKPTTISSMFL